MSLLPNKLLYYICDDGSSSIAFYRYSSYLRDVRQLTQALAGTSPRVYIRFFGECQQCWPDYYRVVDCDRSNVNWKWVIEATSFFSRYVVVNDFTVAR